MWKALVVSLLLAPCVFSTMTNKDRLRSFLEQHKPGNEKREVFSCVNGDTTLVRYVCDGDNDCGDCTDEVGPNCDKPCVEGQWRADDFLCDNGRHVSGSFLCDGDNDCGDCSDESQNGCDKPCTVSRSSSLNQYTTLILSKRKNFHAKRVDKRSEFQCTNGGSTDTDYICDGDNDCGDCSDEMANGCTLPCVEGLWNADDNTTTSTSYYNINETIMGSEQDAGFLCANNQSTSSSYICDGDNDCGDCSDEMANGCALLCVEGLWNPDDFVCDNGESTSALYVCDGDNDCDDCSDERQPGCDKPCVEGQWNARTANKKRQQKKTLMKKHMKRELAEDPMAECIDACKEQTGCTEDNRLNRGCNQMLSCSHACKIRSLGVDENSCKSLCERNGQSGCGVTVAEWTFRLCTSCQRSGCNTHWPTIQECQVGCYSYESNTDKESAETSVESTEDESSEALECLNEISNAIHDHPDYSHLHNNTDVNDVCDILLMDHRDYFCGCMEEVSKNLSPDQANMALAAHPHGINIEGLAWEKECCCNKDMQCPVEENHAMACMTTISVAMEHWSQTTNLTAHAVNGQCDVDGTVKDFFCGCMSELALEATSDADVQELLSLHSHGITLDMLKVEAGACCLPPPTVPATVAPTSLPPAANPAVERRRMLKKLQYLLNKRFS